MEYVNIDGLIGGAVSKMINKGLAKTLGFKPNLNLDRLIFQTDDARELVEVKFTATMSRKDFERLIEEVTK